MTRPVMQIDTANLLTLFYVAVFPSTLAYLCFNRGVQLIGANRAAPFFHRRSRCSARRWPSSFSASSRSCSTSSASRWC